MSKQKATILFYACLALSAAISYFAFQDAAGRAYGGDGPILWMNIVAFFVAVGLVGLAIYFRVKGK